VFAFIISNGRSGSTLVQEILARHPDVGFIANLEDRFRRFPKAATRFNNAVYRRVPQALTRKGRARYAPSEGWRLLNREVSPLLLRSTRDLLDSDARAMRWIADDFRSFFEERARLQGKPLFLHKFTGWPRTGFIRVAFPDARFINVVRDGRAVVASDLRIDWWRGWLGADNLGCGPLPPEYLAEWEASGRSFPLLAALSWKVVMNAYAAARELVPAEQWLDVRYEDVLADPQSRFKEMLDFLGLRSSPVFDLALKRAKIHASRGDAFRRLLDAPTIELLNRSLGEHLRAWGYEV
jgi:hypothetical protein